MTVSAGETFSCAVIGVAEGVSIGARSRCRGPVDFAIVTDAARRDLTACRCFARRSVTGVTTVVGREVRGDREANTAIDRRIVTARASSLWPRAFVHVLRVIKLHVEWFVEACREIFEWWITGADVCVTDHAHRHLWCGELAAMTISAGLVTRKARCGGVVRALMT